MATVTKAWADCRDMPGELPAACPRCSAAPFSPFLRGRVYSAWRWFFRRPSWALICWACKDVVGWER